LNFMRSHSDLKGRKVNGSWLAGLLMCIALCSCKKKELPPPPTPPPVVEPAPAAAPSVEGSVAAPTEPATRKSSGEPANPKEVKAAFDKYSKNIGGPPGSWEELIEGKLLRGVPLGRDGKPLDFTAYQEYLGRGGK
jgi:hypothetical protein